MKKKIMIIALLMIFATPCMAAKKAITKVITAQDVWIVVDSTTSSGDEPNDLAVGERTYATVKEAAEGGDAEISIQRIDETWNAGRFRCIGDTNDSSVTYQIYLGTLGPDGTDCELAKAGQLAFTIGTQASTVSTYEMAHTVTVTSYCWAKAWSSASPGSNLVAEAAIDLMGADILVAVPTTAGCDCKLLFKGF